MTTIAPPVRPAVPARLAVAGVAALALLTGACAPPLRTAETPPPVRSDSTPPGEPVAHEPGRVPPPGPYLPGFDALHYHIALTLPEQGARISAVTTIDIALRAPRRDTLRLDLTGLRVTRVDVTHRGTPRAAPFHQHDGRVFIALPPGPATGDTIRVAVTYDGTPDDGLIIRANVHGQRGAFADNWPDRARFWFPAIDHPSDKATASFEVRAPAGWQVVANGARAGVPSADIVGDALPPADGVWRWRIEQPIPTYLMVIGATRFTVANVNPCARGRVPMDCVPTGYWVFPADTLQAARTFRRAAEMIAFYSDLIAPFPYSRLAHVQSATRFGGMENAGAIFYSEQALSRGTLSEGTVAHETAHQWFGDAVTPARWSDLWLSEGFATYFGALFFETHDGRTRFREMVDGSWRGYLQSNVTDLAVVDTVRTPGDDLLELLNANSYNKGGAVLHMLRGVIGDSMFFGGVRRYYERHVHGNATTAAFRAAMSEAAGRDLGWFFEQWLYRPGHPIFDVSHRWDARAGEVVVTIAQLQKESWPVFRVPMEVEFALPAGVERRRVEVTSRSEEFRFRLSAAPVRVTVDPDGWVLKTVMTR